MTQKYSTGVRFNHQMGVLETLSFIGEGVGAALYLTAVATGQAMLGVLGIIAVLGAVVALLAHLGRPARSWRALTRLATSGVSRGTAVISGFLGCAIGAQMAPWLGLPVVLQTMLTYGAALFALPVIVYGGLLLRSMKAIRLWNGPFVPLAFAAHSLTTATILAAWLAATTQQARTSQVLALVFLLLAAVLSTAHLLQAETSTGVKASLERLLRGDLRGRFLWGAGMLGLIVPLGLMAAGMLSQEAGGASALLALAALARLYGDFAYRNSIVLAGAYEPIMPTFPQRPLGPHYA